MVERFHPDRVYLYMCVGVLFCVAVSEVEQEAYVEWWEWRSHRILTGSSLCLRRVGLLHQRLLVPFSLSETFLLVVYG